MIFVDVDEPSIDVKPKKDRRHLKAINVHQFSSDRLPGEREMFDMN